MWAITSYYNPHKYRRRALNYQAFRNRLQLPLVTVELSFDGNFELADEDANVMVRRSAPDVMWHKERLLNIALAQVPDDCDKIAWLDCDLIFDDPEWVDAASKALQHHPVIQPFERSYYVHRDAEIGHTCPAQSDPPYESLASALSAGRVQKNFLLEPDKRKIGVVPGLAWAARREVLEKHSFYDACIMGCGDGAIVGGALGQYDDLIKYLQMTPDHAQHYLDWARPFYESVQGDVGSIPGSIYHLWHGEVEDRHYLARRVGFGKFGFNPYRDVAIDTNNCWRWNSQKPQMHEFVRNYFALRKEDGG